MPRKRAANQTVLELMERNGASGATTETETKDGRKRWRRIKPAEATTLALTVVPLVASGETNVAIARKLDLSEGQVMRVVNSPAFQLALQEYRDNILVRGREKNWGMLDGALDTLKELHQTAKSEHVRYEAAIAIVVQSGMSDAPGGKLGGDEQREFFEELRKAAAARTVPQITIINGQVVINGERPAMPGNVVAGEFRDLPAPVLSGPSGDVPES
jgi:hypothetical protein